MCFKCNKKGHIAKDCKGKQVMKKQKVQEGSDDEDKENEHAKFIHSGLSFSISLFIFIFISVLFFYFSIFRTTRVRVDQSRCHISHNLMA